LGAILGATSKLVIGGSTYPRAPSAAVYTQPA